MIKMTWRHRRRQGRRGRFPKPVTIPNPPKANRLVPEPETDSKSISIEPAEAEALRLVDLEGLSQIEAGLRMGISRGTVWRLLQSARRKVAKALIDGRPLVVSNETDQATQ